MVGALLNIYEHISWIENQNQSYLKAAGFDLWNFMLLCSTLNTKTRYDDDDDDDDEWKTSTTISFARSSQRPQTSTTATELVSKVSK